MDNQNEQFHAARRTGIGGSDVAAVLGISPWKTQYQLWEEKTGRAVKPFDDNNDRLRFGNLLENVVACEFSRRRGLKVQRRNELFRHPDYPMLIGNIDRRVVGGGVLEIKTADKNTRHLWGDETTDQVPEYYLVQLMHYLYVLGQQMGFFAVLIGGNEYRDYEIPFDAELAELASARCVEFWNKHVLTGEPPPLTARDDLSAIFRFSPGTKIDATPDIEEAVAKLSEIRRKSRELKAEDEEVAAQIKLFIGENETLAGTDGKPLATWKQRKATETIVTDWNEVCRKVNIPPEVINECSVIETKQNGRTLLLK